MKYADSYREQDDIALLILSTMMTPFEEQYAYDLYEKGIPDLPLSDFESYYTKHIKPNTLLMSLKLSNDQERLRTFIKNESRFLMKGLSLKLF